MRETILAPRLAADRFSTWVFVILVCTFLGAIFTVQGNAQISPGPLSDAHQALSSNLSCTKCHEFGKGVEQLKCLECHAEIRERITGRRGMHAVWLAANATGKDCAKCHSEHNGANFPLIYWQPSREAMDHSKTGFPLTGAHIAIGCNGCHRAANIPAAARVEIQVKDLNSTYLGLSRNCVSCHTDEHRGQVGNDCARCHTEIAWKPVSPFNHADTKFPLTGAHVTTSCDKCHVSIPDAKPYVKYTGLSFKKCTGCHNDPHKGGFTAPCQSCHNTTSWPRVAQMEGFDHSKTNFPLLGKHRTVGCSKCHNGDDFKTPVAHNKCMDCHAPDPHNGQFQARPKKGECAECHNVDGWKPSFFGVKEHSASAYPLLGKHAAVSCDKCHIPSGADTRFKIKSTQCSDCHKDAHDGQFSKAPYENQCESCHTVNDFHRSKFTIAMHENTRFPLDGAHAVVPCIGCHKEGAAGRTDKILPFHFEDRSCTACHEDPHHGEFKASMAELGAGGKPMGCTACHNAESWINVKVFDHSKTDFPLIGAHRTVACNSCHIAPPGTHKAVFKGTPKDCEECHSDVHGAQFAQNNKTLCSDCHNSERWVPSIFDHEMRTSFSLTGGHADVACKACHKQTRPVGNKDVIIYSLAPSECAACHGTRTPAVMPVK